MSGDFVLNFEGDIVSPGDLKQRGGIRQNGRGVVPHTPATTSSVCGPHPELQVRKSSSCKTHTCIHTHMHVHACTHTYTHTHTSNYLVNIWEKRKHIMYTKYYVMPMLSSTLSFYLFIFVFKVTYKPCGLGTCIMLYYVIFVN